MVDIHHHLLFGIDDGSPDLETSVAMVESAVEDGITHIVCTPHANDRYAYDRERNLQLTSEIRNALPAHIAEKITLGQGCDFHLNYDNLQDLKRNKTKYTINGNGYLLIELPNHGIPQNMTELIYDMQLVHLTPILTHPERNATLQRNLRPMIDWMRSGMLVQITAGSIAGSFGPQAATIAHEMLEKRWVHFVATDAHNLTTRPPKMRTVYDTIAAKYGEDDAYRLCTANPLAVFEGIPLPEQPEPKKLYEEMAKKSWLQRLLGR